MKEWYSVKNLAYIDTPALLVYPDRVMQNISRLIQMAGDVNLLRPHVKTNKSANVSRLMVDAGITKFKCATIAEAEMLGRVGAADVLLAYQPTAVKVKRLIALIATYPKTKFSCLVDNAASAQMMSDIAIENDIKLPVFIDLNVGMNRTGILPDRALELLDFIKQLPGLEFKGLHAYDGHINNIDFAERTEVCNAAFVSTEKLRRDIKQQGNPLPLLVAGGSPTFAIHAHREHVELAPGTFVFWDKGYTDNIPEQKFDCAAVVLTRVISLPEPGKICIDLGHKSIASENDLQQRVYFLNAPHLKPYSHSEEHMVIIAGEGHNFKPGDELYALPIHICPTVAQYDSAYIIEDEEYKTKWPITARGRELNV
jgi:D-serine deaminase-like pyridoxal phosphate-dependent protein